MTAWNLLRYSVRHTPKSRTSVRFALHRLLFSRFMSSDSHLNESPDVVLSRVADYILKNDARRIVVLAGAGISTASGIPDFRTPGSGLYDNLTRYNLPWPEAVFDLEYFYSNPKPFYELAKELYPSGRYRPNVVHYFIRLLNEQSRLLRVYTQNIDSLERIAGIPDDKLVEAHGSFLKATCTICRAKAPENLVKDAIDRGAVAKCTKCGNVIKPDIVFFGENLPDSFWKHKSDLMQTDLVFVMGTSLEVHPFAGVADIVSESVPRVLFNRDLVGSFRFGFRPLDMVVLGEVTQSVNKLASLLKWSTHLEGLMKQCEGKPSPPPSQQSGTHATKSNSIKKSVGNNPNRRYSTTTTPVQFAVRPNSVSSIPAQDRLNLPCTSTEPPVRFVPCRSRSQPRPVNETAKHAVIPHEASAPERRSRSVRSLSHDSLPIGTDKRPTAVVQKTLIPVPVSPKRRQPRDALTALRAYLYRSSTHTSDSESTDSAYSFLNSPADSSDSDKNKDTKCSNSFTD